MFSATKGGSPSGYQISRSVRLRSSASAYFNRTMAAGSAVTVYTFSAWVKRGELGTIKPIVQGYLNNNNYGHIIFKADNTIEWREVSVAANYGQVNTNAVFRDPSAWYHIVVVRNGTSLLIYVNGASQTLTVSTGVNASGGYLFGASTAQRIGSDQVNSAFFDGYLTECYLIDGQALTPASFGSTNATTGVWQPIKYTGTYGTNGFYLNFSDNSAATAAAIGKDYSGNGNNWTPNNISVTAGVTYDSMIDVPTQWADGGNGRGNYCTGNPLIMYNGGGGAAIVPKNGNLDLIGGAGWAMVGSTIAVSTGKWYWEATFFRPGSGDGVLGIHKTNTSLFQIVGYSGDPNGYGYSASGNKLNNTTGVAYGASYTNGDVIGVALDLDAGTLTFYKNNTSQGVAFSGLSGEFFPAFSSETAYFQANFGQRPFSYTPPTGFKALNTLNLPTPTILKGNQYFDATLWTGNGSTQSIVNAGSMQPDLVWYKRRNSADNHRLFDSVRGVTKPLFSDLTNAESTESGVTAFNSNGFSLGLAGNESSNTYVGWQWKANGTPAVTNTAGTITSTVSVGATQGFSVATFTSTGASATVGHGLGVAPSMIILKSRNNTSGWNSFHISLGNTQQINLQSTAAATSSIDWWRNTSPTSSVFTIGANFPNTYTWVAYCFAPVAGFSAFGSYTGNGSTDGPFVFLGFRPRWILTKAASGATGSWWLYDTARSTYNEMTDLLRPDLSNADTTQGFCDALSNGFKIRNSGNNTNGATYIYAAFCESPFKNSLAR
jgi:hypothetical protein